MPATLVAQRFIPETASWGTAPPSHPLNAGSLTSVSQFNSSSTTGFDFVLNEESGYFFRRGVSDDSVREGADLQARISQRSSAGAAGLMVRDSESAGAPFVFFGFSHDNRVISVVRRETGGALEQFDFGSATGLNWVRVIVGKETVYAYTATERFSIVEGSENWTLVAAERVSLLGKDDCAGFFIEKGSAILSDLYHTHQEIWSERTTTVDEVPANQIVAAPGSSGGWQPTPPADPGHAISTSPLSHIANAAGGYVDFPVPISRAGLHTFFLHAPVGSTAPLSAEVRLGGVSQGLVSLSPDPTTPEWLRIGDYTVTNISTVIVRVKTDAASGGGQVFADAVRSVLRRPTGWSSPWWTGISSRLVITNGSTVGSLVRRDAPTNIDWNAGAYSGLALCGDGIVRFYSPRTDKRYRFALSQSPGGNDLTGMEHRLFMQHDGTASTEYGHAATVGYNTSMWMSMERIGGRVLYRYNTAYFGGANGGLSSIPSLAPVMVDCSIRDDLGRFAGTQIQGWTAAVANRFDLDIDGITDTSSGNAVFNERWVIDGDSEDDIQSIHDVLPGADTDGDGLSDVAEFNRSPKTNPAKADTDGDGMPDGYEVTKSLNPSNPADASTDADADDLSNFEEYELGTEPNDNDTDDDGLLDGWEVLYGLNPLSAAGSNGGGYDADDDGLTNAQELTAGTNPQDPDTDADGLNDGSEVLIHFTAPLKPDSDFDGLSDQFEVTATFGFSPVDDDSDDDGLNDWAEWRILALDANDAFSTQAHALPEDDFDGDGASNLRESVDGTDPADPADFFSPVVFNRLFGSHSGTVWTVETNGTLDSSRLVRNLPVVAAGGISHHEAQDGTRVRFQFLALDTQGGTADQVIVGFSHRGPSGLAVGDLAHYAAGIRLDPTGKARLFFYGNEAPGFPAFDVAPTDLVELRLELTAETKTIHVEVNQEPVGSVPLPSGPGGFDSFADGDGPYPLAVVVQLHGATAGVHNLRYRLTHDPDRDNDLMADRWEQQIIDQVPEFTQFEQVLPGGDADEDDLTNLQEYQLGTDPASNDTDGDGMLDGWEVAHGLDPLTANAAGDPDGDGLTNLEEYALGIDPGDEDTDGDGLDDGWEVDHGFNPLSQPGDLTDATGDLDEDGLSNLLEYQLGSDPGVESTAGDGFPDGWKHQYGISPSEVLVPTADPDADGLTNLEEFQLGTHPNDDDTDSDGMIDGWEVSNDLAPLLNDAAGDLDNDGLTNLEEFTLGTMPNQADTDGDGLADGWEVEYFFDPLSQSGDLSDASGDFDQDGLTNLQEFQLGSRPDLLSTAGDGLSDGWKHQYGIAPATVLVPTADPDADGLTHLREFQNDTHPNVADTDGDGMPDGWEVDHGLDPLTNDVAGDLDTDGLTNLEEYARGTHPNDGDTDGDGLGDWWEVEYGFNPLSPPGDLTDATGDLDEDGLSNLQEFQFGTRPDALSTVGDGLSDGWKYRYGIDPFETLDPASDTDSDGLTNLEEYQNGTNPNHEDTDGDGMPDAWELNHGVDPLVDNATADADVDGLTNLQEFQNGTHPADDDTDNDEMTDGWEVSNGLNPVVNDAATDLDGDGLANLEEYALGTDPRDADSDDDGLGDWWEVEYGFNPLSFAGDALGDPDGDGLTNLLEYQNGSHPYEADTDGDAMHDGWEVTNGLNPLLNDGAADLDADGLTNLEEYALGTHANQADTDGDGLGDWWEAEYGFNPLSAFGDLTDATGDLDEDGLTNLQEFQLGSDPDALSTAGDGLSDGWKHLYGIAPTQALVPAADPDNDGLSNLQEFQNGTDPDDDDTDGDGMPDGWEVTHGLDPLLADATGDLDEDNLTNLQEFQLGSNPTALSTAGDGLSDGWKHLYGIAPGQSLVPGADPDQDGLTNQEEYQLGTHPNDEDTDGDGLEDGWEDEHGFNPLSQPGDLTDATNDADNDGLTNLQEFHLGSNPQALSTANDGFSDGWKHLYGIAPNQPLIPTENPDNDGLTNLQEFQLGSNPNAFSTAGDGLSDGWKHAHGILPTQALVPTADPDDDGLSNLQESQIGTDPNDDDTDGDEMPDGWEHLHGAGHVPPLAPPVGLNPLNPADATGDPDDDNFSNLAEYEADTDPHDPESAPPIIDVDQDGMSDPWELQSGLDPANPADAGYDWDYDGLTNLQEYRQNSDPRPKWRKVPVTGMPGWVGGVGQENTLASPSIGTFNQLGQLAKVELVGNAFVAKRWDPLAVTGSADGWDSTLIPLGSGIAGQLYHVGAVAQNSSGLLAAITGQNVSGQAIWRLRIHDGFNASLPPIGEGENWKNIFGLRVTESGVVAAIALKSDDTFALLRWRSGNLETHPLPRAGDSGFYPLTSIARQPQILGLSERGEVLLRDYGTNNTSTLDLHRFSLLTPGSTSWTTVASSSLALGPYGFLPGQTPPGEIAAIPPGSAGVSTPSPLNWNDMLRMPLLLNRRGDWGAAASQPAIDYGFVVNHTGGHHARWAREGLSFLIGREKLYRPGSGYPAGGFDEYGTPLSNVDSFGNPLYDEFSRPLFSTFDGQGSPLHYADDYASSPINWSSFASSLNRHGDLVGGVVTDHSVTTLANNTRSEATPLEGWGDAFLLQRGRTTFSRIGPNVADFNSGNIPTRRGNTRYWKINDSGMILASQAWLQESYDGIDYSVQTEWYVLVPDNDQPVNGVRNGLPDDWEIHHFGSVGQERTADPDTDLLTNGHEVAFGTIPRNSNTDSDPFPDGREISRGLNPLTHNHQSDDLISYFFVQSQAWQEWIARWGLSGGEPVATLYADPDSDGLTNEQEFDADTNPLSADTDNDGVDDHWEIKNTFNPRDPSDASTDYDEDGLSNLREYEHGTDPKKSDSDNDGMTDGWEVASDLDPLYPDHLEDYDRDGLSNLEEFLNNTLPFVNDTDHDHIPDGWEVGNGLNPTNPDDASEPWQSTTLTNLQYYISQRAPELEDLDRDGLPDNWESANGLDTTTDDSGLDPDDDTLVNLLEYLYSTNPQLADTDSDGMPDGWELKHGINPTNAGDATGDKDSDTLPNAQEFSFGTNPNLKDTDSDGIDDSWEFTYQLNGTDPLDATMDSDGDGLTNIEEYAAGTNPNLTDSDGDNMDDFWELTHQLDPRTDDSFQDFDRDTKTNLEEYQLGTTPASPPLFRVIAVPANRAFAASLTDERLISGSYFTANGMRRAFLWSEEIGLTDLGPDGTGIPPIPTGTPFEHPSSITTNQLKIVNYFDETNSSFESIGIATDQYGREVPYIRRGDHVWSLQNQSSGLSGWSPETPAAINESGDVIVLGHLWNKKTSFLLRRIPDIDGDGIDDVWELEHQLNPLDPADASSDFDDDDISALQEYHSMTDPGDPDSDNDSLPDAWELSYSMDPLDAADANLDFDEDGINNSQEYANGTSPIGMWDTKVIPVHFGELKFIIDASESAAVVGESINPGTGLTPWISRTSHTTDVTPIPRGLPGPFTPISVDSNNRILGNIVAQSDGSTRAAVVDNSLAMYTIVEPDLQSSTTSGNETGDAIGFLTSDSTNTRMFLYNSSDESISFPDTIFPSELVNDSGNLQTYLTDDLDIILTRSGTLHILRADGSSSQHSLSEYFPAHPASGIEIMDESNNSILASGLNVLGETVNLTFEYATQAITEVHVTKNASGRVILESLTGHGDIIGNSSDGPFLLHHHSSTSEAVIPLNILSRTSTRFDGVILKSAFISEGRKIFSQGFHSGIPSIIIIQPSADYDEDGMLDSWEREHFGDLSGKPEDDFDSDGRGNLTEFLEGTNPLVADPPPPPALDIRIVDGNNQILDPVSRTLPSPLVVEVRDSSGNSLPNVTLEVSTREIEQLLSTHYSTPGSPGTVSITTDVSGRASVYISEK